MVDKILEQDLPGRGVDPVAATDVSARRVEPRDGVRLRAKCLGAPMALRVVEARLPTGTVTRRSSDVRCCHRASRFLDAVLGSSALSVRHLAQQRGGRESASIGSASDAEISGTLPAAYDADGGSGGVDALVVEPRRDRDRIEAEQVSPFDVRDASFGDESADVADADAEVRGEGVDVDEVRERRWFGGSGVHA